MGNFVFPHLEKLTVHRKRCCPIQIEKWHCDESVKQDVEVNRSKQLDQGSSDRLKGLWRLSPHCAES